MSASALQHADTGYAVLEGRLGYTLEPALLVRALTHRSYAYENGGLPTNERLEFLGDSVLGLVVTDIRWAALQEFQKSGTDQGADENQEK